MKILVTVLVAVALGLVVYQHYSRKKAVEAELAAARERAAQEELQKAKEKATPRDKPEWMWDRTRPNPLDPRRH